jgi:hypothetical protein
VAAGKRIDQGAAPGRDDVSSAAALSAAARLRDAMSYPAKTSAFSEAALRSALKRVGLKQLVSDLDRRESWDKHLSFEEQQAVGFARVLLRAPNGFSWTTRSRLWIPKDPIPS